LSISSSTHKKEYNSIKQLKNTAYPSIIFSVAPKMLPAMPVLVERPCAMKNTAAAAMKKANGLMTLFGMGAGYDRAGMEAKRGDTKMADFNSKDKSILCEPQIVFPKVCELLRGKYEIIPKTKEHIKVDISKCIGMTCQICYVICPTGSYEMVNDKAEWKYGKQTCGEYSACRYVCPANAIEWSYPDACTVTVLKYS
jgi:ferredoxin-like protein FixX